MLSIKRTALNEVAASRRRVRMVKRKRGLEAAPLASCGVEERMKLLLLIHLTSAYSMEGVNFLGLGASIRKGNIHRDRSSILRWAHQLDDVMFRRQFRLCREDFLFVVNKISVALHVNRQQAINSSGSSIPVELMLMITLRILAGASYLDMIHYHVHVDSVNKIVWSVVCAIHSDVDNIKIAANEEECIKLARVWSDIQKKRWGEVLTGGTIYAGDGLIIEIMQPDLATLRGRPIQVFRNRKNIWAVNAQGFCDANTRFGVLDCKWPGGTNDIVAYNMTDLCHKARDGVYFPAWACFVLDEAYGSIGGMHLTPYTLSQLKYAKRTDIDEYFKMVAFNNVLSSQRITIERAFGILIRRWGILWRPITYSLEKVPKIIRVCGMLHNICIDRWVIENPVVKFSANGERVWPNPEEHDNVHDASPEDDEIIERLHNNYVDAKRVSTDNSIKRKLTQDIYDAGIRTRIDTEFHQI